MNNKTVRYTCVTCGICCKGRLVPLTLQEAEQWLARGDDVAVILEAFSHIAAPETSPQYRHDANRAATVDTAGGKLNVIAIFAGNSLSQCPNLQADNLCGIYEERPLVCRIYPMEINPFIALREDNKICPPESWGQGEILCSDGVANPPLQALINQSRQADISDATTKVAICTALGMDVASWKGDGFAIHFPQREALLAAIQTQPSARNTNAHHWKVRTDNAALQQTLLDAGIPLASGAPDDYVYQAL